MLECKVAYNPQRLCTQNLTSYRSRNEIIDVLIALFVRLLIPKQQFADNEVPIRASTRVTQVLWFHVIIVDSLPPHRISKDCQSVSSVVSRSIVPSLHPLDCPSFLAKTYCNYGSVGSEKTWETGNFGVTPSPCFSSIAALFLIWFGFAFDLACLMFCGRLLICEESSFQRRRDINHLRKRPRSRKM